MNCSIIEVIKYLPSRIRELFLNMDISTIEKITEIRLKAYCPVLVLIEGHLCSVSAKSSVVEMTNGVCVYSEDVEYTYGMIIRESVYAYEDEISNCFVTLDGGHRAGISGTAIVKDGNIRGIKDVSGIYFRIAREYLGCANCILDLIQKNGRVFNTVIAAPPGKGKTTVLREIARVLSESGLKVSLIDERHEISAQVGSFSSFDLHYCDILNGFPKAKGIERAVRTLSPDVLIFDELGSVQESESVNFALNCGVSFITSAHASSLDELLQKKSVKFLTESKSVDLIILYDLGSIKDKRYLKGFSYDKDRSFELDLRDLCDNGLYKKT